MTLEFRRLWLVIGFGFVLFVIYLSLTPDRPHIDVPQAWKFGHVLAYTWLMLWYAQIYASIATRVAIAILLCLLGVSLEYLQGMTDYRTFAYFDMGLNACGVAIGFMLALTPLQFALRTVENLLLRRIAPRV